MTFIFKLKEEVTITLSGAQGTVKGRGEYADGSPNTYLVKHLDGDGNLISAWYDEVDLRHTNLGS